MWQIFPSKSKVDFEKLRVSNYCKWNVLEIIKCKGIEKFIWNKIYFIGDFSPEAVQLFLIV